MTCAPAQGARTIFRLALSLLFAGACSDDPSSAPELLVRIRTDLRPGAEVSFLRAEVLDAQGTAPADFRWFAIRADCPVDALGQYDLGSFSVARGDLNVSRIAVFLFAAGADGTAVPVVAQRVDVAFGRGRLPLTLALNRSCRNVHCEGATTCDPDTGGCHDVVPIVEVAPESQASDHGDCLSMLNEPPPVAGSKGETSAAFDGGVGEPAAIDGSVPPGPGESDGSTPPPEGDANPAVTLTGFDSGLIGICVTGDGVCPAICDWRRDADCLLALGEPCAATSPPCVAGATCVHGVCCDQPCTGACDRCDLAGQLGHCAPLLYASPKAPMSSPDFAAECSTTRVRVRCTAGVCQSSCSAGFADCDEKLQESGCETPLGTINDCRACGDACAYGYCGGQGCEWTKSDSPTDGSWYLQSGAIYATLYLPSAIDTTVRALGVLVNSLMMTGQKLRLAVYQADGSGLPYQLKLQTAELTVEDNPHSLLDKLNDTLRVEGTVAGEIDIAQDNYLAIQVSAPVFVYSTVGFKVAWRVAPYAYGQFPTFFPFPGEDQENEFVAIYVITTPQ